MSRLRHHPLSITKAEPSKLRPVHIIATPVKASGPIKQFAFDLVQSLSRSRLIWSTHWAIKLGDTYFELQRIDSQPQPRLRTSSALLVERDNIVWERPVGHTVLSDEEVTAICHAWFENAADSWYDVFANNCQSLVYVLLNEILITPEEHPGDSNMDDIKGVSFILTRIVAVPILLSISVYLRLRQCDAATSSRYVQMYYTYVWYCLARLFIAVNHFWEIQRSRSKSHGPTSIASLMCGLYVSFVWIPIYHWHALEQMPLIRKRDGHWTVFNAFKIEHDSVAEISALQQIRHKTVQVVLIFWLTILCICLLLFNAAWAILHKLRVL